MKTVLIAAVAASLVTGTGSAGTIELIVNGGFETGTFAGWTKSVSPGSTGDFFVVPVAPGGTLSPLNAFPIPGDLDGDSGSFAAMSEQTGTNAVALSQVFTVPAGTIKLELSFENFIDDYSAPPPGASPVGPPALPAPGLPPGALGPFLDETVTPSQYALFDILVSGADPLMTMPLDVVTTITNPFPKPAFPAGANPWLDSGVFDLTGALVPGGTYMMRFGEVDNLGNLLVGFDNISLKATLVPLPPALLLLTGALLGLGGLRRRT